MTAIQKYTQPFQQPVHLVPRVPISYKETFLTKKQRCLQIRYEDYPYHYQKQTQMEKISVIYVTFKSQKNSKVLYKTVLYQHIILLQSLG